MKSYVLASVTPMTIENNDIKPSESPACRKSSIQKQHFDASNNFMSFRSLSLSNNASEDSIAGFRKEEKINRTTEQISGDCVVGNHSNDFSQR